MGIQQFCISCAQVPDLFCRPDRFFAYIVLFPGMMQHVPFRFNAGAGAQVGGKGVCRLHMSAVCLRPVVCIEYLGFLRFRPDHPVNRSLILQKYTAGAAAAAEKCQAVLLVPGTGRPGNSAAVPGVGIGNAVLFQPLIFMILSPGIAVIGNGGHQGVFRLKTGGGLHYHVIYRLLCAPGPGDKGAVLRNMKAVLCIFRRFNAKERPSPIRAVLPPEYVFFPFINNMKHFVLPPLFLAVMQQFCFYCCIITFFPRLCLIPRLFPVPEASCGTPGETYPCFF